MPEKILIPLDGSKLGETALRYVEKLIINLSAEEKVEITLIQILSPSTRFEDRGDGFFEVPLTEEEMEPIKKEALDYLIPCCGTMSEGCLMSICALFFSQILDSQYTKYNYS